MPPRSGAIRAGRAFVELFADDSALVRGLRRAQKRVQAFGRQIRDIGLQFAKLGAAIVAPLTAATKIFAGMGDTVAKMARRTGLSVEALSELGLAAELSGASMSDLESFIRRMQRSIFDAERDLSTAVDGFKELGLTFRDLKGLAPEDQLNMVAEGLSRITDPSKRAGVAMTLFGRSATQLLPLMERGAAGMSELRAEARSLGLTISAEDAAAAEELTDAFTILWRTLKQGVFVIGSALAPLFTEISERVSKLAVTVTSWIRENKELVVTLFKVGVGILGVGTALVVLGTSVVAIGAVFGGLATVAAAVGTALSGVITALAAIVSPIGLVVTAVAGLGAAILHYTGAGAEALKWLGERFGELKDFTLSVVRGISDALADGDINLAAKVLWSALQVVWTKGVAKLNEIWNGVRDFILRTGRNIWDGAVAGLATVLHGIEVAWIETTNFLSKLWTNLFADLRAVALSFHNWLTKRWLDLADVLGLITTEQAEAAKQMADDLTADDIVRTENRRITVIQEREAERQQKRHDAAEEYEDTLAEIGRANLEANRELDAEHARRLAENQAEVEKARAEFQGALAESRRRRFFGAEADDFVGPPAPDDWQRKLRRSFEGFGEAMEKVSARIQGDIGTFSAAAIRSLEGGRTEDQIARNTSDTVAELENLRRDLRTNRIVFS